MGSLAMLLTGLYCVRSMGGKLMAQLAGMAWWMAGIAAFALIVAEARCVWKGLKDERDPHTKQTQR